jgi:hypothetical protein
MDVTRAAADSSSLRVELKIASGKRVFRDTKSATAQQSIYTRYQLARREGFDDEIIRPRGKAAQAKGFLPSRREHDNWQHSCRLLRAQSDTNFGARHAGQHPIENDEIGRRVGELA